MAFDFEVLIGHLYVVGGRALNTQPPGTLVEVAPKKAARGRELDTFFVLVTPSGDTTAPTMFYEQMANLGAERYFSSSGSVTAGLRTVFTSLNQDLVDHNGSGKQHYEANMTCAVLRDNELILARAGSGVAIVQHEGTVQAFPTDFSNDEALFGPPLGVQAMPDIKMSRYPLAQNDRLVLADSPLADLDQERVKTALGAIDIGDVLTGLKEIGTTQITLMAAEFVPPEAPSPASVKDERSSSRAPASMPAPAAAGSETAPAAVIPDRPVRKPGAVEKRVKQVLGTIALFLARIMEMFNHFLDRLIPPPAEGGRNWMRTSTATAIAILIPVIIVVLVVVLGFSSTGDTAFELCVQEANKTAGVARGIASSDVNGLVEAWNAVITVVNRCNEMRPNDPTLLALTQEAQGIIDALFWVERRDAIQLASFTNAVLTRIVLQGLDIYALDSQNNWVYRVSLSSDGTKISPNSQITLPLIRIGATVGQFRVGKLIDIAWSEDSTQILALDDQGVLIACSPRFLQTCEAQRLLSSELWATPTRMAFYKGRLYILDPGANQIWRYEGAGGNFSNSSPTEYFAGESPYDIRAAVDFAIDAESGYVFVLGSNGVITKWVSGEQTPFGYVNFPDAQPLNSADAFFLDSDPIAQDMFIVNRANRTIYQITLSGTFMNSYRVFNESDFASLSNVVADSTHEIIYTLSGNSIFALDQQEPIQP